MAKKRKEKSRLVDGIIALFFSLIFAYLMAIGLKMVFNGEGEFVDNILHPSDVWSWLKTSDISLKILVSVIAFGAFVFFMKSTSRKDSGYKDASSHGAYGDATFSSLERAREEGLIADRKESLFAEKNPLTALGASEGIILGRLDNELAIVPPNSSLDNRNVLVVGSSGSAKGQAFVINNIINNKRETLIVTDPKGELYNLTSDIKKDQGYKVHQIDFINLSGSRYNPLDYVEKDFESIKLAQTISQNSAKDAKQDFFFNTARDLLTGLIIYVTSDKKAFPKPNISKTIKGLFNKISEDENFLKELTEEIGDNHPSYQYFKDASVATAGTRTSILQSFAQQTGIFSLGDVARLTEESDINFYDLQEEKSILYVKIPVNENPVPALTATFFDQLIETFYRIGDQNGAKLKIPAIFLLDEFANIGKLNAYDNVLSTCRGYEWSMVTIVQDFAQLEQRYSKELSRTIANNHDTTLFLRTKDVETAKYFETLAGDTTIKYSTNSRSGSGGFMDVMLGGNATSSRSISEQYIKKPLISSSDLLNMSPSDKCYVFMTGHTLELKKAYQSLIYKDFITKQDGFTDSGRPRYVYCYPENREKYIKKFNLKPNFNLENNKKEKKKEKTERIVLNKDIDNEKHNSVVLKEEKEINKDQVLENIVMDFFSGIESKKKEEFERKEVMQNEENEFSTNEEEVKGHIAIEKKKDQEDLSSDPDELISFMQVTKIKKTDELQDSLLNKKQLFEELNLKDDLESSSDNENMDDELPM
ncbi:VirD4-like conjugal transfer protein, CD1115 family [Bacillus amyloliquefaciens]|uniref:VirD4-like conjugal transfer protein, CD1115 family n=1 Tax=Bacillus amyloliquefaciens TaxID=1390 RepID=UPI002FF7ADB8